MKNIVDKNRKIELIKIAATAEINGRASIDLNGTRKLIYELAISTRQNHRLTLKYDP